MPEIPEVLPDLNIFRGLLIKQNNKTKKNYITK